MGREDCREGRRSVWNPKGGVVLRQVEFDRDLMDEMRRIADADGLKSVYQVIRKACLEYVRLRKGETGSASGVELG